MPCSLLPRLSSIRCRPSVRCRPFVCRLLVVALACSAAVGLPLPAWSAAPEEGVTEGAVDVQANGEAFQASEGDAASKGATGPREPITERSGSSGNGEPAAADQAAKNGQPDEFRLEELVQRVRPAVVVISAAGRDSSAQGVGTGFVVSPDGLIATNLHVIGEGRPLRVQTVDRRELEVEAVHAWDRELDLAVLRVATGGRPLPALQLGDSAELPDGLGVVVMGNPFGWKHSVVSGVLSGTRDVEGRQMLQLAVPIEPGNSGGPVMDRGGRVLGVVTMKSAVSDNLGFAVQVNDLKPLLERPNPTPFDRWLKIGSVDPRQWSTLFGAQWFERGGRIRVQGKGSGFGGRSLCLSEQAVPETPFEVRVSVRLQDESGAAGLIIHSDGKDRHYGFYPSNGRLRLSRFEGPDVFSWKVLREVASEHYRPGAYNVLKVRAEEGRLRCYVNDQLVIDQRDDAFQEGRVGLAKFRDTEAEFKDFQVGRDLPPTEPPADEVARVDGLIARLPDLAELTPKAFDGLLDAPDTSQARLRGQAEQLERRAEELRKMASEVARRDVCRRLAALVNAPAEDFPLLEACLLIAQLDDPEVDISAYLRQVDRMAGEIRAALPENADRRQRLAALDKYLFEQNGFHGSRYEYYHAANSHLHRVIDDRVGLPITLSVLYMELARRLDVEVLGIGLPGHFVVRPAEQDGEELALIDVFHEGRRLSRAEAAERVRETAGVALVEEHLEPVGGRQILLRVLGNLRGLAERRADREAMLRYLDAQLAIDPEDVAARGARSIILFETGRHSASLAELDAILRRQPAGLDLDRIRQLRDYFERRASEPQAATR